MESVWLAYGRALVRGGVNHGTESVFGPDAPSPIPSPPGGGEAQGASVDQGFASMVWFSQGTNFEMLV